MLRKYLKTRCLEKYPLLFRRTCISEYFKYRSTRRIYLCEEKHNSIKTFFGLSANGFGCSDTKISGYHGATCLCTHARNRTPDSPEKKRNSPVGEGHTLEELVQGCLDAQLLRALVVERVGDEPLDGETRLGDDREPSSGFLVRHWYSQFVLIVLSLSLEVGHHEVAGVYGLPGVPAAACPITAPGVVETALTRRTRHRRRFPVHQLGLHSATLFRKSTIIAVLQYVNIFLISFKGD